MIDKLGFSICICCACFLISLVSAAPTAILDDSTNTSSPSSKNIPDEKITSPNSNPLSTALVNPTSLPTLAMNSDDVNRSQVPSTTQSPSNRLQASPATPMKSRKNKNDLFFCCSDDASSTDTVRRSKERERNTKPPILKKGKNPESEEPFFERRPALLLRFFPDGTAVLISKFQLYLHVKPKQIKFDSDDEDTKMDEPLDYNPGVILNDGKSFEVTYKRLEAIPSTREQNLEELSEDDDLNKGSLVTYTDEIDHQDHELVTPTASSTNLPKSKPKQGKPSPLLESTESPSTTSEGTELSTNDTIATDEIKTVNSEETTPSMGNSPFFVMTAGEMSSLQQQYEPVQASPLIATIPQPLEKQTATTTTEETTVTQAIPTTITTTLPTTTAAKTEESVPQTESTTTTTKCLSFKNQLSLVLSTEDNIDNSLLKKQILPTQDCNTSEEESVNSFARLQSVDTTATETTFTTQPTTHPPTTTPIPTTTPLTGNNLVPYLSSRLSNNPSRPDVVVVTSLPVLIDLKNSRNKPVTDVPAWREVTVGVVRDQQGQPIKPRYNNWTAHLRGLKKKPENKFWNELTTPKPDFKNHQRLPIQQNFQQSPSQVNHAFWTDLQRQRPPVMQNSRDRSTLNSQPYITNPPQSYPASNSNTFQVWRHPGHNSNGRWNDNANPDFHSMHDIRRTKAARNSYSPQGYENQEARQPQLWNSPQRQIPRRW